MRVFRKVSGRLRENLSRGLRFRRSSPDKQFKAGEYLFWQRLGGIQSDSVRVIGSYLICSIG
jgi:hypothetical protein